MLMMDLLQNWFIPFLTIFVILYFFKFRKKICELRLLLDCLAITDIILLVASVLWSIARSLNIRIPLKVGTGYGDMLQLFVGTFVGMIIAAGQFRFEQNAAEADFIKNFAHFAGCKANGYCFNMEACCLNHPNLRKFFFLENYKDKKTEFMIEVHSLDSRVSLFNFDVPPDIVKIEAEVKGKDKGKDNFGIEAEAYTDGNCLWILMKTFPSGANDSPILKKFMCAGLSEYNRWNREDCKLYITLIFYFSKMGYVESSLKKKFKNFILRNNGFGVQRSWRM